MSYNVSGVNIVKLDAWMYASDVRSAADRADLPEVNFLDDCFRRRAITRDTPAETRVILHDFNWCDSGSHYDSLATLRAIAEKIHGTVEAIFIFEGGDSFKGLRIVDGVLTWHEVEMKIGKQVAEDAE